MSKPAKTSSIARNLRRLRLDAGLTQAGLAEASGVADATISRIERGRLKPTTDLAEKLAKGLRLPAARLLDDAGATQPKGSLRAAERRLLAVVRDLDEARVDDITRAVKLVLTAGRSLAR